MLVLKPFLEGDALSTNALVLGGALAVLLLVRMSSSRPKKVFVDKEGNVIKLRKIHVPKNTLPVLGNLLEVAKNGHRVHDYFTEQCFEFNNEPWTMRIPGQPEMLMVSTPELVEELTTTQFDNFPKGEYLINLIEDLLGNGLISSDGERWYHQRKTAVKFFSAKSLRAFMMQSMKKNMQQMYAYLDDAIEKEKTIDLQKLLHQFTLQTFTEMGLGVELDWIGSEDPHPFERAADEAPPIIARRSRVPPFVWKLERWFGIGPEGELRRSMDILRGWMGDIIQQSLDNLAKKKAEGKEKVKTDDDGEEIKSVMELFADSSRDDVLGLRSEDLVDFIQTFVLAARDTTAVTLSWMYYALRDHPEVEKKLYEEITTKLPQFVGDKDAYLTTDHVRSLTYLEAVIRETIRLYPAAPMTHKEAAQDTVIGGDIFVKKGQGVGLLAYAMARSTSIWGCDATEFKPERWIDPITGEVTPVSSNKWFSFHSGPRVCIGMNLALMELRVLTANLLLRYHFEVDPTHPGMYEPALALPIKDPLLTKVHRAPRL
ncbi:hypothetical protein Poli38472_008227 [Pythium oligandrum]|uniref:Cytochrome P450 n=1 Tax=Pythium oligandrum TaxID=41045 RepID=A0A8K1CN10_PYTOL|nr:hypothetical protein Poli38472_008227 [Pythium oligandrum]|eukprot:TMW65585.1 hypothetical protein Poli38472_008227 [Pythium oligandrum]